MKIHPRKIICRIFSFLCAVMILCLSPYAKYIDASSVTEVHAVFEGIGGGVIAGEAILKALLALLAAGGAYEVNKQYDEGLLKAWADYHNSKFDWLDDINDHYQDKMMTIYNNAQSGKGTVDITWGDYYEWASSAHDTVVDDLTDIYVQYCPELLQSFNDFVTDLFNGDAYVPGLSESLDMVDTFTDYESIRNADGSYHVAGYYEWTALSGGNVGTLHNYSYVYSGDPLYRPFGVVSDNSVILYIHNDTSGSISNFRLNGSFYQDGVYRRTYSDIVSVNINASINIPKFSNMEAAIAAFETDTFSTALNFTDKTMESVIDLTKVPDLAPDIPPFTRPWQRTQWGEASDVIDFGGIAAGEYEGDDLPFWGLAELDEFAQSLQDIFEKALEGIFEGTDVIEFPTTYDDVWDDVFTDAWDRVKDGALDIPVDDTGEAALDKVRPYPWEGNPAIPDDPAIPDNPAIDTPVDSVVDIPIEDIVPTVSDSFFDVAGSMRYKFPFSIPWDIHYMLTCLAETPKAPRFELPLVVERYNINEKIIIDMEMFQTLSELSRSFFSMLFAIFLVNLTFKVVGMRKEE